MYTIIDYLKYYGNTNIDEIKWNILDNLVCAILTYLPLEPFVTTISIKELNKYQLTEYNKSSVMTSASLAILELINNSKRYKNLTLTNFVNTKNNETQFGAVTFRINNETIVGFKGTDHSLIGWFENFRISYEYPTYTQQLAIDYLNNNIRTLKDNNLYIVGHSKGGNLAMVSAMETKPLIFNKIKQVCNFDGPGFRNCEFVSEKYNKLSKKLVTIVPPNSIVGMILNNKDYQVIKSNSIAFGEHYPTSWNVFGSFFIDAKLSNLSNQFHESTTRGIEDISYDDLKETLEQIFKSFEKEYKSDLKFTYEDFFKFYKNMKNIDPKIAKQLDKIIDSMVKVFYLKNQK